MFTGTRSSFGFAFFGFTATIVIFIGGGAGFSFCLSFHASTPKSERSDPLLR
jgi:hypothetical protein